MVIRLSGGRFLVGVILIVARQNSIPGHIFMIDHVFPAVFPDAPVPVTVNLLISGLSIDKLTLFNGLT